MRCDDSVAECRQGRSPVHLVDANPSVAGLEGAAFAVGKRGTWTDEKSGIRLRLVEKLGTAYRVRIEPAPR